MTAGAVADVYVDARSPPRCGRSCRRWTHGASGLSRHSRNRMRARAVPRSHCTATRAWSAARSLTTWRLRPNASGCPAGAGEIVRGGDERVLPGGARSSLRRAPLRILDLRPSGTRFRPRARRFARGESAAGLDFLWIDDGRYTTNVPGVRDRTRLLIQHAVFIVADLTLGVESGAREPEPRARNWDGDWLRAADCLSSQEPRRYPYFYWDMQMTFWTGEDELEASVREWIPRSSTAGRAARAELRPASADRRRADIPSRPRARLHRSQPRQWPDVHDPLTPPRPLPCVYCLHHGQFRDDWVFLRGEGHTRARRADN